MTAPLPHARYWPSVLLADTEWDSVLAALEESDMGWDPTRDAVRVKVAEQVYAARNAKRGVVASEVSGPGET